MYYKFNGFTQRLVGAGASAAYTPQGLKPVTPVESPVLIFGTPTKTSSEVSSPVEHWSKNRVPELQKLFQKPDGVPVHLKRGFPDQLLYRTTMALTIGGAIYCLVAFYMMASPKRER